jgi:hypothetical protein
MFSELMELVILEGIAKTLLYCLCGLLSFIIHFSIKRFSIFFSSCILWYYQMSIGYQQYNYKLQLVFILIPILILRNQGKSIYEGVEGK